MPVDRDAWTAPDAPARAAKDRVPGAMGGSRLLDQPQHTEQRRRIGAFVAAGPPLAIEIGFDHGINLLANARMFGDQRWLGVEIRKRRVAAVAPNAPENCLAERLDARTLFAVLLPGQSVHRVDILFPTPALKGKHLLLTPAFAADVLRALHPDGVVHLLTDVPAIAALFDHVFAACPAAEPPPRAPDLSRRERVCRRDDVPIAQRCVGRPRDDDSR